MKQKEFYDLAAEMEKQCGDWENSEGLSDQTMAELLAKIEAMDAEASKKEFADPAKTKRFRMKKRYILILAAALVLLMGMGVAGDRVWRADSNELSRESEVTTKVNNEEKDSVLREEEDIYQEIADKLGIAPMRFGYFPEGMVLDNYMVMENTGWVSVNYVYREKIISIKMAKDNIEISSNVQWDGQSRKLDNVENDNGYEIEAYCVDEENHNYSANMTYGNGYYNIFGAFEQEEEFLEILKWIYFKTM